MNTVNYVNHGGVAIVGPTGIRLTQLKVGSPQSFEHLCARVSSRGSSCVILLIYRPGSSPATSKFFEELSTMLESLVSTADPIVVTGDINIRLDRPSDPLSQQFNELIESFGLINSVSGPTHDLGGSLDVVLTRADLSSPVVNIIDTGLSDHSLIKWSTQLHKPPPLYVTSSRRPWRNFQLDKFKSAF